jgi:hypothetical protein
VEIHLEDQHLKPAPHPPRQDFRRGAHLRLKILIVDVKEVGFSPFGGVNFYTNVTGGVYVEFIPDSLRELVKDKPLFPGLELARDGWELLDIVEQKPAEALEDVQSSRANSK